jgi:hypothetical protein
LRSTISIELSAPPTLSMCITSFVKILERLSVLTVLVHHTLLMDMCVTVCAKKIKSTYLRVRLLSRWEILFRSRSAIFVWIV